MVLGKVSIVDNLRRKGFRLEALFDLCSFFGEKRETIDHLVHQMQISLFFGKRFILDVVFFLVHS